MAYRGRQRIRPLPRNTRQRGTTMGLTDKARNATQDAKGKVKETAGKVSDDDSLQAEGKRDQAVADLKQAGEKVKDAFKD